MDRENAVSYLCMNTRSQQPPVLGIGCICTGSNERSGKRCAVRELNVLRSQWLRLGARPVVWCPIRGLSKGVPEPRWWRRQWGFCWLRRVEDSWESFPGTIRGSARLYPECRCSKDWRDLPTSPTADEWWSQWNQPKQTTQSTSLIGWKLTTPLISDYERDFMLVEHSKQVSTDY